MKKIFKFGLLVILVVGLMYGLVTCNKQKERYEPIGGLIEQTEMVYTEKIQTSYTATYINGDCIAKDFEVIIPVYTNQLLDSKVLYKSVYSATTLSQTLYYSVDNGLSYNQIGIVKQDNRLSLGKEFNYNLPNSVPRYTYFSQNEILCRIDWGNKLQLLIQYTYSLFIETNSNYSENGTYSYNKKFNNGFNSQLSASCFFMIGSVSNTPTNGYLSYLDGTNWVNILTWQDLKAFLGDYIKFNVDLTYSVTKRTFNGGGNGGGSW